MPGGIWLFKKVIPPSGQNPPERQPNYRPGEFVFELVADSEKGDVKVKGKVIGKDEGGYNETSKMLGESALCLALEVNKVMKESGIKGGLVTPAVLGRPLLNRLVAKGMVFEAEQLGKSKSS